VLKLVKTGDFKGENMKKLIVLALFLSVVGLSAFAREATIAELVEMAVSKLDQPVPAGFQRVGRTNFINDDNLILVVGSELVFSSIFGNVFATSSEAHLELGRIYDFFESRTNNWTFYPHSAASVYQKNGVYAAILRPTPHHEGGFTVGVMFARDFSRF
jgi:hypothetical protein